MNERCCAQGCAYLKDLLEDVEYPAVRRLMASMEHLFRVPVAYVALFGRGADVLKRIGSGEEYWPYLKMLPKPRVLQKPFVITDTAMSAPDGLDCRDLRFIATAPVRTADGIPIGAVVIGGREPRPEFTPADCAALAELSALLSAKLELRTMACHALQSELSMHEAERRFHAIADCAPVLMSYTDRDGACVFVNRAWLEFTGRTMSDELGDGWLDPVHPDHRQRIRHAFWKAFQARRPFQDKALFRRFDGEYRWAIGQASPRFHEDGAFAGMVGAITDITDAHYASLELQKQKQCTAAMSASLGALYFVLDHEGRIEQMCPEAEAMTPPGEVDLRGQFIWDAIPHADQSIRWAVQRSACSRSPVAVSSSGRRWAMTPLTGQEGELLGLCVSLTERRE